jgi:hypothetical protein
MRGFSGEGFVGGRCVERDLTALRTEKSQEELSRTFRRRGLHSKLPNCPTDLSRSFYPENRSCDFACIQFSHLSHNQLCSWTVPAQLSSTKRSSTRSDRYDFFHRAGMDDTEVGQKGKSERQPDEVARQGIDALLAGKDHVYAASFKTKLEGALANVVPGSVKGAMHEKMAKPNSEK